MKKLIAVSIVSIVFCCCNNKSAPADASSAPVTTDTVAPAPIADATPDPADGLWTGQFDLSPADTILRNKAIAFQEAYDKKMAKKYGYEEGDEEGSPITDINEIPAELRKAFYIEPLNGYYAMRYPNKVSVFIDAVNAAGEIGGHSVCAGKERPLRGTYRKAGNSIKAELKEPGDDPNDGVFTITFTPATGAASGTWTSKTNETKSIELSKKDFAYDVSAGEINYFRPKNKTDDYLEFKKNPSKDVLVSKDVENLTKPELTILRNLIYARHGYAFASASMRNYFEIQEWYFPLKQDIRNDLTDVERKNLDKLKSYEKYAADSYDEFGR